MIYDDTTNGVDNADIYPKLDGLINDIKRKFEINEELNFVIIDDYPSGPDLGVQRKYKFNYRSKKGSTLDNVLIITKGIFKIMNSDELEMLIAHEFSHIKNKDTTALNYIRKKYLSLMVIPPVLGIVLGAGVELVIKYNLLAASLIIISYFIIAALEGARAYNSKKRSIETRADEDALNVMLNPDALRN